MRKADFEGIPLTEGELPVDLFDGQFSLKFGAYWESRTGQAWVPVVVSAETFDLYATGLYFEQPWYKVASGTRDILLLFATLAGLDARFDAADPEQMHVYHDGSRHRYNYGLLANNLMRRFPVSATEAFVSDLREQLGTPRVGQMKQLIGG